MSLASTITFGRSQSKNNILESIKKSISDSDTIGSILKKRKNYKNAEKRFFTYSSQKQKNDLRKKLKNVNNNIVQKLGKSNKLTPEIEKDLYYIYKNSNTKDNIAKILREKKITRNIKREYKNNKSTWKSFKKGVSSVVRSASNMTGLSTYKINRLKRLKADAQILRKKKNDLLSKKNNTQKENNYIINLQKQINIIKEEIKKSEGINYNETLENYSDVIFKNYSKFNLDIEYNKLLLLNNPIQNNPIQNNNSIIIYKNLLTVNQLNKVKHLNIPINSTISINNNFNIFEHDNKLFEKFSSSVPYSEYNFLYGIDKHSSLAEERLVALLYMTKIIFAFFLEPHLLGITTIAVISLLLSRFALDYYRKYKRTLKKNIIFCVKYFGFDGMEHFSSELIAKYHKIMYYGKGNNTEKNKKFYESVIDLSDHEEKEFIEKNVLFVKYLEEYKENIRKKGDKKISNAPKLEEIVKTIGKQVREQEENVVLENNSIKISTSNGKNNPPSYANSQEEYAKLYNPQQLLLNSENENEKKILLGGGNLRVLKNNRNKVVQKVNSSGKIENIIFKGKPKLINKKITEQFSEINRAVFRLNYRIGGNSGNYVLTSGDINVQLLFIELKPIINSRSTFFEGELKPISKSIPFFTNDYLINLIDLVATESTKYGNMNVTIQLMIDFIKEYIDNFTKLYQLSKYNILLLLNNGNKENDDKLLLKELFKVNISYTAIGRYTFSGNPPNEYELKEIKYRDKLNYYCLLLKYCQIALDHIHKRFKISIVKFDESNYGEYDKSENKIITFFNDKLNITSTTGKFRKIFSFATKEQLNPYSSTNDRKIKNLRKIVDETFSSLGGIHTIGRGGL